LNAPEIRAHCDRIARQYGLYDNALFHTEVTDLEWDPSGRNWMVRTNQGDEFTAQFVGIGTGPLHVAKLPGIPGLETFAGRAFHTSRWDYAYTGGDPDGAPMDRLGGRRVAIIGTGATAVQCVPHLAGASNGSLPPGSWWPGSSTPSTASSTPRASRSVPRRRGGTGST
jgi:cation diffusion facilitator CzcD-associated flavoprotein CzcO